MNNFFKLENIDKNISVSLLGKQKDPRQLEFEFPDQNRELKKQSDSKEGSIPTKVRNPPQEFLR